MNISIFGGQRTPLVRSLIAGEPVIRPVLDTTAIALRRIQQTIHSFIPILDTIERAKPLFTNTMHFGQKSIIVEDLNKLPENEREVFVRNVSLLISDSMDNVHRTCLVSLLRKIPANEREVFVQNVKFLFEYTMDNGRKIGILSLLSQRSADQRQATVQNIEFLISDSMDATAKMRIISTVLSVPVKELREIPANEREVFLRNARPLISDSMDNLDRALVAYRLQIVPANEREVFVQNVEFLFDKLVDNRFKIGIMANLQEKSADQRQAIVQYVKFLISDSMDAAAKTNVIRTVLLLSVKDLVVIPENEVVAFTKTLKLLLTNEAIEREFKLAFPNETQDQVISRKLAAISVLAQRSANEREAFAQKVNPQIEDSANAELWKVSFDQQAFDRAPSFEVTDYDNFKPLIEERIQPVVAQTVLKQNKSAKRTSHL